MPVRERHVRIIHVSDTHGHFPALPKGGDLVVHSGDLCPNATRGNLEIEPFFQQSWLRDNAERFKRWLDGRPMLVCRGNHDFTPAIQPELRAAGLDVTDITNRAAEMTTLPGSSSPHSLRFYGFPYVNFMCGEWAFEATGGEIAQKTEGIPWGTFDVLVAHSPIAGILDECYGDHIGNRAMAHYLAYTLPKNQRPIAYLHGHAHEANGQDAFDGMIVSNAATVVWCLTIPADSVGSGL